VVVGVIFFFSGTGNTWWLAKSIAKKLVQKSLETITISIETQDLITELEKIDKYDLIGFGYPIYGSGCPELFDKFIKSLPQCEEKECFIFTSMMAFSGDGALVKKRQLERKGYKIKQAVNIVMPNNIKLPYPIIEKFPMNSRDEINELLNKAEERVNKLVQKILNKEDCVEGYGALNKIGGLMQRIPVRFFGWSRWAENFFVDYEDCTECMQCVKYCPTGNIQKDGERFVWGDKCICCMRCYNLCPEDAIQYKRATLDRKRFPRYKGPIKGLHPKQII
jgi:Pyruvate/2-oxoacid:ferredoxin oxidoreductase delta subunit/flavodoxin